MYDGAVSRTATSDDPAQLQPARRAVRALRAAGFLTTVLEMGFDPD